jgi:hypothetical protein
MSRRSTERDLVRAFTGMVVESLAVKQDFGAASVGCRACGAELTPGDRVTVTISCYEDYSWEMEEVYCGEHTVGSVAETMGVRAERQAVVEAVLEQAGYIPPRGNFEPDALTLGEVEILDYSPTEDGY